MIATIEDVLNRGKIQVELPLTNKGLFLLAGNYYDDYKLADYNIQRESTIHLVLRIRGGGEPTYFVDDSLMDPKF